MSAALADARPILTLAPSGEITAYDRMHAAIYLRLLDAEEAGADWREVAQIVLGLGPSIPEPQARSIYSSHLNRAHWLVRGGYKDLLKFRDDPA
jgi:hypothetical protein